MRKRKSMIDNKPMFSKSNFKYILVLTALAWMTYTLPSVQAAFDVADAFDGSSSVAAVGSAGFLQTLMGRFGPPGREIDGPNGSSTPVHPTPPPRGEGSSTPPFVNRAPGMGQDQKPPLIAPQEIVAVLVKQGFIPSDQADAAHKAVEQYVKSRMQPKPTGSTQNLIKPTAVNGQVMQVPPMPQQGHEVDTMYQSAQDMYKPTSVQ